MKRLWPALVSAIMVSGLAFAAGDEAKPPAPPAPPNVAPPPPDRAGEFDPTRLPALLKWNNQLIAQWEARLGMLSTDEAKKVLTEAITKAKEYRAGLERLSDAVQAGRDDEAGQLTAQLREKRLELMQFATVLPTWMELDQAKALQAERGKDNPDLNARCQRIIDLLNKRLALQKQIGAVNREIFTERQALQQPSMSAPGNAPAVEPSAPAPAPAPKSKAKPSDAT